MASSRTIYYTAEDMGDGSLCVSFYESQACIEKLEEHDPESFRGEGGGSFIVIGEISGITIETMVDVNEYLSTMGFLENDT